MTQSTYDLIETALVTGGAGGIGRAIAEDLIKRGKKVIIAGRTESKLQSAAKEIGAAGYYVLDTSKVEAIPDFVKKVLEDYKDLNTLINNAGVQRPFEIPGSNFSNGDYSFDLSKADQEIDTNIRGPMHLTIAFLPHFTTLPSGKHGVVMNVSSVLGYCPFSVINPVYNGTKAWTHFFTENMRTQLAKNKTPVKVIEIAPPTIATDLHRERTNPDDNKKSNNDSALELPEFMNEVSKGLQNGQEIISAGMGVELVDMWQNNLGKKYHEATA